MSIESLPAFARAHRRAAPAVAVFDPLPVVAEGISVLLAADDAIEVVGTASTAMEFARIVTTKPVDVFVVGMSRSDAEPLRRLASRLAGNLHLRNPRFVGIVNDDFNSASLLGEPRVTAVRSNAGIEALRDAILDAGSGSLWTVPRDLIRPRTAPSVTKPADRTGALTPRERDVLDGIERGLSTREIAHRLDISVNTARTHAQRLMSKLGVHSRLRAAALSASESRRHQHDQRSSSW